MKAIVTDQVHQFLIEELNRLEIDVCYNPNITNEELLEEIYKYEILVINTKIKVDKNLLDRAKKLKVIGRLGSGLDNIDLNLCKKNEVAVLNSPEGNRVSVAEHTLGMLLSLFNNLCRSNQEVREFSWKREKNRGEEIEGKTIAIIGYGNTGMSFAKLLSGFNCEVLAFDKYKKELDDHAKWVEMSQIFERADVLSLHIPLTEETTYLINDDFISKFKKPFYLLNTSRGMIVNTNHLNKHLDSRKIKGACLDVLEIEKFDQLDNKFKNEYEKLFLRDNVLLSPHIAGWTHQSKRKIADILSFKIAQNL